MKAGELPKNLILWDSLSEKLEDQILTIDEVFGNLSQEELDDLLKIGGDEVEVADGVFAPKVALPPECEFGALTHPTVGADPHYMGKEDDLQRTMLMRPFSPGDALREAIDAEIDAEVLAELKDLRNFRKRLTQPMAFPKGPADAFKKETPPGCPWTRADQQLLSQFKTLDELREAAGKDLKVARAAERMGIDHGVDWREISIMEMIAEDDARTLRVL